jgi:hypothetical protein
VTPADQIAAYVACVFDPADCVEVRRLPCRRSSWHRADALPAFADSLAQDNRAGENIYVGANPRLASDQRGDDSVELARCVFADFDKTTVEDALRRVAAAGLPVPTLTVASGHGAHVFWRFDEPFTDMGEWRRIQKNLIALLSTDPHVHNPERIMRLPGFENHKLPVAACAIVEAEPTRVYAWADVLPLIPPAVAVHEPAGDAGPAASAGDVVSEGGRNTYLMKLAGTMRRQGMTREAIEPALLIMNRQQCRPPLAEDEVRGIAGSASKYQPTPDGDDRPVLLPAFKTARELLSNHPHLRPPVIHGLLRQGETMNLIAPSKTGKSWLVNDLALSIATGRVWLGKFMVERGDVLILDNELHGETTANRLPKVAEARGILSDEWVDRLHVENLRGRLADVFNMRPYFDAIQRGRFKVIVLDAFYRFMPRDSDENDNGTVADIYNQLDRYAAQLDCGFILIHHSTKGSQSEKAVTDVGAGAGAQSRAADTHLILRAHEQDGAVVMDAAVRSWAPIDPLCLRWGFPIWTPDESLDPAQLRRTSGRRRREPAPVEQSANAKLEEWAPERFVAAFVTTEPADKKVIAARARMAKLGVREIDTLLTVAEADGRVHRWAYPKDRVVYLATRPQTVTETMKAAG